MAPGSRGVGAVFVHSSDADSGQTGNAIGEPRVPRRSRSHYLSNAPGLADQLVASRKDSAREGGSCAAYFCKVPDSRESELGLREIWPREQRSTGVFLVRLRAVFRSGFRLTPINSWRSESSTSCMDVSFFPMCPGSQINLLRVRKTLCASVATSVETIPGTFSKTLFCRPVFTRVVDVAPDVGFRRSWYRRKACVTYFSNGTGLAQRRVWELLMIRKLHAVAEVNLLPKGLGSWTKLQRVGENLCANVASQIGCFVNNTYQNLAKCSDRFFAVLAITLSFLVRFRPVKYGIEALDILYTLVKGWELGQIHARTGTRFEKKRARSKMRFSSRTAAFARRVFPTRNKLILEPGCVGKITTPATTWNSRLGKSIPRLTGIFTGKVNKNSSDTPTSESHNSLVQTPIHANFILLERGRQELSGDMLHDPF
uniref:Uncharacterized protein n=1 Tax=Fagus sylvatica TaxID=28930 RepID=A0A2N9GA27_FAGSY